MKKSANEQTTRTKTGNLEITAGATRWTQDEWDDFVALCEKKGMKPTDQIRRLVREFVAGRYVNLNGLRPDSFAELEKYADEIGVVLQVSVDRILTDFLIARRRERTSKK